MDFPSIHRRAVFAWCEEGVCGVGGMGLKCAEIGGNRGGDPRERGSWL